MKKLTPIIFISIFILSLIFRTYKITSFPPGLYDDEISIGYNAYSVLKTGKDEYGVTFPFWFKAFGEYKLPFYIYLTSLSMVFLGETDLAVRFPSALIGTITVAGVYFLVKSLFTDKNKLAFLSSFLLAVSPWHIQFSRAGFEVNIMVGLIVWAIYFFLRWVKKKNILILAFSLLLFVLSIYTYNAARLITPLIIFSLILLYFKKLASSTKGQISKIIVLACVVIIMLIPFLVFSLSKEGNIRASMVSFTNEVKFNETQSSKPLLRYYLLIKQFLINYFSYFSTDYLFISGDQQGRHSVREMGQLYLWQLLVLVIAFFQLIKLKKKATYLILVLLFISVLPASLSIPSPHALRSLLMVVPISIISAFGLEYLASRRIKGYFFSVIIFIFVYSIHSYIHIYYKHYPVRSNTDWKYGYKEAILLVNKLESQYERVVISDEYGSPYIYFLFYTNYNPNDYLKEKKGQKKIRKFEFVSSPFTETVKNKTLYLAPGWENVRAKLLNEVHYNNERDIAFKLWEL